ncbi:MAG: hypothetical protein AB1772_05305 [Candidatus Zixiibacteriota bacterium]
MNEKLRKKIVFATLPLALAWAGYNLIGKKNPSPAPTTAPTPMIPPSPIIPTTAASPKIADLEAKADAPWGRDPFQLRSRHGRTRFAVVDRSSSLAWTLAGIIHNNRHPLALINNRMVGIGERVDSATIVAIEKETVTLEYQGRRIKLKLTKG